MAKPSLPPLEKLINNSSKRQSIVAAANRNNLVLETPMQVVTSHLPYQCQHKRKASSVDNLVNGDVLAKKMSSSNATTPEKVRVLCCDMCVQIENI